MDIINEKKNDIELADVSTLNAAPCSLLFDALRIVLIHHSET